MGAGSYEGNSSAGGFSVLGVFVCGGGGAVTTALVEYVTGRGKEMQVWWWCGLRESCGRWYRRWWRGRWRMAYQATS